MLDVHTAAKRDLARVLVAALIVDPLGPGLDADELRQAALQSGMSPPLLDEIIDKFWDERCGKPSNKTVRASQLDLMLVAMLGNGGTYPPLFPMRTLDILDAAFTSLEQRLGVSSEKSLEMLVSECNEPPDRVSLALGMLLVYKRVKRAGDGFVRQLSIPGSYGGVDPRHPESEPLTRSVSIVRSILARRLPTAQSALKPLDRFHSFLKTQGWHGMASWWAATVREVAGLWDHYPTAATVLAGALLEGALVAIAEPAKQAGQWNQKFLLDDPRTWQLRDLIKQAEAAQTFSANEAAHARTLADVRNRIHPGRFAAAGPDPFKPPYTNAHEAGLAKLHLELLVTRILEWQPIASLC